MNVEECARLVAMVRSIYPAQRFDDDPQNVVRAWGYVVADLTFVEAQAAVARLARRGTQWLSPGEIRTECARARHVLSPDVDQLLDDVRQVAARQGVGRKLLHPAALVTYDSIGGAEAIKRLDVRGLQSLRRQLLEATEKHDARVLEATELPPPRPELQPVREQIAAVERVNEARELEAGGTHGETAEHLRKMKADFGKLDS